MLKILGNIVEQSLGAWAAWRQRERAYNELYALDDRALADIGISRADIPCVLSRSTDMGETALVAANAANANVPHAA